MSDNDSGVDAGSDSNGSMSVGSNNNDDHAQQAELDNELPPSHEESVDVPFIEPPTNDHELQPIEPPKEPQPQAQASSSETAKEQRPEDQPSSSSGYSSSGSKQPVGWLSSLDSFKMQFISGLFQDRPQNLGEYSHEEWHPKIRVSHRKRSSFSFSNQQQEEKKLLAASGLNDANLVRKLLDQGVSAKCHDERLRTPLHMAACKGDTAIASMLLDYGADPNATDIIGNTPLHLSACTNHTAMVTLLIKGGANIRAIDNNGRSPLDLARSKLRLLKQTKSREIDGGRLKSEVLEVVELMQIYLQRSGKMTELDALSTFTNRLHLHQTKEEVDSSVDELLVSLDHLSLQNN